MDKKSIKVAFGYIIRIISIAASIVLALFLKMFDGFVDDQFDFNAELQSNFKDPSFWLLTGVLNIVWLIVYYSVYTIKRDAILASDDWNQTADRYRKLNSMKIKNFVDFIRILNLKRKKEAYQKKWNRKLVRVQARIERNLNLLNWRLLRKYANWRLVHLRAKEQRRKDKLDETYIDSNINYLFARYNHVSINDFTFNKYTEARITDKTSSNEDKRLLAIGTKKILLGFLINGITVAGVTYIMEGVMTFKQTGFWITLLSIFISSIIQVYFAISAAKKITDSEIIGPTIVKTKILEDSLMWSEADSSNIEFLKALNEQLYPTPKKITITKEQLERIQQDNAEHKEEA